ncbi:MULTISPECIES: ATP-binding protein [Polymorphospora]|uniref:histidine kinase n=1 Tax=Polymorphospora lycopeni TaxID=3140240 RepID=A0ABV5CR44_9ACTN
MARDQAAHLDGVWQQAAALARDATTGDDGARIPLTQVLHAVLATVPSERARLHLSPRAADRLVDGQRVRQILINLVDNALRHGPAGGQVSISARIPADDLVIVVADEGTSCAAVRAMLRRREPSAGMSGLGLWIVGCLVAAQGGRVRAYPLRPRGVAVEVVLRHGPRGGRVRRWPRWAAGWPRRASEMGMSLVSAIRHRGGHHVQSRQGPAVRGQAGRP